MHAWILKICEILAKWFLDNGTWIGKKLIDHGLWSLTNNYSKSTPISTDNSSFRIGESYNRTRLGQTVKIISLSLTINFPFMASSHHSVNNGVCDQQQGSRS